jgi:hypothetical protein
MGRELGRISGPLLADNLLRRGQNLAFETNLLYFDVVNKRIGINNTAGATNVDLFVSSTINTTNLNVNTTSNLANFIISGNNIYNGLGAITIQPNQTGSPTIVAPSVSTDNLNFSTNIIQNIVTNNDINITSTGKNVLNSNTLVTGNLEVVGNITFDGNVTLGNNSNDTVTFEAEVNSDIKPSSTLTYDLGSNTLYWSTIYTNFATPNLVNIDSFYSNDITFGSLGFANNSITTSNNQDLNLVPNGTGRVNFSNFIKFINNTIINTTNSAVVFANTNTQLRQSHWKFSTGTTALVMPSNSDTSYIPEDGTIRFNPTTGYGEVYTASTGWASWNGPPTAPIYQPEVSDESLIFTLILGL